VNENPNFAPLPLTSGEMIAAYQDVEKAVEALLVEYKTIDAHVKAQNEAFAAFIAPYTGRLAEIKSRLLALSIDLKRKNFKTDAGTAYQSIITTPKVEDSDKLLDAALDNWEEWGQGMIKLSVPVDAVKAYMDANLGQTPPGVTITTAVRMNVRL
jgi:hypothetical protein